MERDAGEAILQGKGTERYKLLIIDTEIFNYYFIVTLNEVWSIKVLNHYVVHLKLTFYNVSNVSPTLLQFKKRKKKEAGREIQSTCKVTEILCPAVSCPLLVGYLSCPRASCTTVLLGKALETHTHRRDLPRPGSKASLVSVSSSKLTLKEKQVLVNFYYFSNWLLSFIYRQLFWIVILVGKDRINVTLHQILDSISIYSWNFWCFS